MDSAVSHRVSPLPLVVVIVRISLEEIRSLEKSISVYPMEKNLQLSFWLTCVKVDTWVRINVTAVAVILSAATNVKYVEINCQLDATDDFYCRSYCLLNMFRAPL